MEARSILAIIAATLACLAFALLAVMFWRGSWTALLLGPRRREEGRKEEGRALGRHMSAVLAAAFLLMATLVLFEAGGLARNQALVSGATMANNLAFVLQILVLIWFFLVQRPEGDADRPKRAPGLPPRRTGMEHLSLASILFVVALLLVLGGVGLLAALR